MTVEWPSKGFVKTVASWNESLLQLEDEFKLFFDVSQTVYGSPVTAGCNICSGLPTKIK